MKLNVRFLLAGALASAAALIAVTETAAATEAKITILYDAFGNDAAMKKDWGFSALIEVAGKRILFDTGNAVVVADPTDVSHEDEVRVQRTEEELRVGTRERKAGSIRVRKRVRTDRERIEVPTRHEEVSVERVPVEGEATEAQIGEDEVVVPVTEEEVIVHKRPMVKEEVRIRKDVVEDTEVVEEDVRREEVEVEDRTQRRGGGL